MNISRLRWLVVCPLLITMLANAQDAPKPEETPLTTNVTVPAGGPLNEGEVIILLQAKVPLDVIQKFVSARGVSFVSTKETSKRVLAAGGNVSLVGTINLNQKDEMMQPQGEKDRKR